MKKTILFIVLGIALLGGLLCYHSYQADLDRKAQIAAAEAAARAAVKAEANIKHNDKAHNAESQVNPVPETAIVTKERHQKELEKTKIAQEVHSKELARQREISDLKRKLSGLQSKLKRKETAKNKVERKEKALKKRLEDLKKNPGSIRSLENVCKNYRNNKNKAKEAYNNYKKLLTEGGNSKAIAKAKAIYERDLKNFKFTKKVYNSAIDRETARYTKSHQIALVEYNTAMKEYNKANEEYQTVKKQLSALSGTNEVAQK